MRIFSICLLWLFIVTSQCHAIELSQKDMIKRAQEYGATKANVAYNEFAEPWMVYEENAAILNDTAEKAYIFTPFLLVANDARGKTINGQKVSLADSESVLNDYDGCLVFSVILFGETPDFMKKVSCSLQQGAKNKRINAYYLSIPAEAIMTSWYPKQPQYMGQCYVYYKEKDIKLDLPVKLIVDTANYNHHRFYFDLLTIH